MKYYYYGREYSKKDKDVEIHEKDDCIEDRSEKGNLIIEDDTIYEIDEECMKKHAK